MMMVCQVHHQGGLHVSGCLQHQGGSWMICSWGRSRQDGLRPSSTTQNACVAAAVGSARGML